MGNSYISRMFALNLNSDNNSIIGLSKIAQANYMALLSKSQLGSLKDLEEYLNYLYYGTNKNGASMTNTSHEHFIQAVNDRMEQIIASYDPGLNEGKIAVSENMRKPHKTQISTKTLEEELNLISSQLLQVPNEVQYQKTIRDLQNLASKINQLLSQAYNEWGIVRGQSIKKTSKAKDLIDEIDKLWQEITYVEKAVPLKAFGDLFEEGLVVASQNMNSQIDYSVQDILGMLNQAKPAGGNRVSADGIYMDGALVNVEAVHGVDKKGKNYTYNAYAFGQDNSRVEVHINSINHYQQKMDVLYEFPNEHQEPLRISAKSWGAMSSKHNLGSTDLLSALLRSTGSVDSILAFGLQANFINYKGGNTVNLHKWAKQMAILDIIAGIGQKNGYADTLVIQDQSKKYIHVYRIIDILNDMLTYWDGGFTGFYLKGYNEGAIENVGFDFQKRLSKYVYSSYGKNAGKIQDQKYIAVIMSALQAQKISVSYNPNHS